MPENSSAAPSTPFLRARLCGFETGRIRRLQGFLRGSHQEPDRHTPAAEAFARRIGHPEIEERGETLYRQIRTGLGWKRRDLTFRCEDGTAVIGTPAFSVTLWIEQDPEEARFFRIGIEVGPITSAEIVRQTVFVEIFRHHCHSVRIDLPRMIDLEETIDRIEASDALAPHLDYAADASWLTLRGGGSGVEMRLQAHQVCFSMPRGGDLRALIDQTAALLADLHSAGAAAFLD